jgi:putative transposase
VREIARNKEWSLLELETMPNHVHLLLEKAPWQDLRKIVKDLKGITGLRILRRFEWLRGELDSVHFWTPGYHYVRHTDVSLQTVREYVRNQKKAGGLTD